MSANASHSKRKYRLRRKVLLDDDLLESPAFKMLSGSEMRILFRFMQKRTWAEIRTGRTRKKERVYDNGNLVFTYDEAKFLGFSERTFHRTVSRLIELGFLDLEHQGGYYGRDYSRYALSERWKRYGTPQFVKVKKERVLPPGVDVDSRIKAKRKKLPKLAVSSCQDWQVKDMSGAVEG